jgi:hypothetical protein|tara:strand:- start:273 stop:503 length:231 start_codon:yes stop_codon:yes gene_type:complete
MDNYSYKVYYKTKKNNIEIFRFYSDIKSISKDFNITKEMVYNLYSKIGVVSHPTITKIERQAEPLRKPKKIVVSFD